MFPSPWLQARGATSSSIDHPSHLCGCLALAGTESRVIGNVMPDGAYIMDRGRLQSQAHVS